MAYRYLLLLLVGLATGCGVRPPTAVTGPVIESACTSWTFRASDTLNRQTDPELTICRYYDRRGRLTFVDHNNFVLRDSLFTYGPSGEVTAFEVSRDGKDTLAVDVAPARSAGEEEVRRNVRGQLTYRRSRTSFGGLGDFVTDLDIQYGPRGRVVHVREESCPEKQPDDCTLRLETRSYEDDHHGNWIGLIKRSEYPKRGTVSYKFTQRELTYYE